MTEYVVLLPGDESRWETASPEQKAEMYAVHAEFAKQLAERGHRVTAGAELTHSRAAKQVSLGAGGEVVVTDGPYAEAAEQLTGFYVVDSDDLADLLQVCGLLAVGEAVVEVREAVDHGADGMA